MAWRLLQPLRNPIANAGQRRHQRRTIQPTALGHVRAATTLATDLGGHVGEQFAGLDLAQGRALHARDQGGFAVLCRGQDYHRVAQPSLEVVDGIAQ